MDAGFPIEMLKVAMNSPQLIWKKLGFASMFVRSADSLMAARTCPVCLNEMLKVAEGDVCPHCKAPARTRSLQPVLDHCIIPRLSSDLAAKKPLLGFAMTVAEKAMLKNVFSSFTSASLFGNYGQGHITGVDVRDLRRFEDEKFSGIFSILLFDYVPELDRAFNECFRVLDKGGILFTYIAPYRLVNGNADVISKEVEKRPGYFDYVPEKHALPTIVVGRERVIAAMKGAGFHVEHKVVVCPVSGNKGDWFIGMRRPLTTIKPVGASPAIVWPTPSADAAASPGDMRKARLSSWFASFSRAGLHEIANGVRWRLSRKRSVADGQAKTYSIPLRSGYNKALGRSSEPFRVEVTLAIPQNLPKEAWGMYFGEHVTDDNGKSTSVVNLVGRSGIVRSVDNGENWKYKRITGTETRLLFNCRTLKNGTLIVQAAPEPEGSPYMSVRNSNPARASIFLVNAKGKVLAVSDDPTAVWHGTSSIDESDNGTIMFAEYHNNQAKYIAPQSADYAQWRPLMEINRVFRSKDGGRTWHVVFEGHPEDIRHFHTLRADPDDANRWWLSSGDRSEESMVWVSEDDGETWIEVSEAHPDIPTTALGKGREQSVFRYTDVIFADGGMIWGTDDIMGDVGEWVPTLGTRERSGSRLYRVNKSARPLTLEELGYCGNPVRSLVDVGPAILVITEANKATYPAMPQVLAFFKDDMKQPIELFRTDNFKQGFFTGLTYSKASRTTKNGRFFSYRNHTDVFNDVRPCVLQWDISFQNE
jgi:Methyltransferase domain